MTRPAAATSMPTTTCRTSATVTRAWSRPAQQQMAVLNTNTRYLHDHINRYAERLAPRCPSRSDVCFFVNSGSEANELALRLARAYTGQRDMIVLEGAYHGHTTGLIDISPYKYDGPGGSGAPPHGCTPCRCPTSIAARYKADDPAGRGKVCGHVQRSFRARRQGPAPGGLHRRIAAPASAGRSSFRPGYLALSTATCAPPAALCIADEVQTGFGRIGTHFCAFEAQGVVPDIVVLGKPIGNGHPMAAVVTTPEIAASFDNGMEFFSTFGGNTVSCAVGLAVLDVLERKPAGPRAARWRASARTAAALRRAGTRSSATCAARGCSSASNWCAIGARSNRRRRRPRLSRQPAARPRHPDRYGRPVSKCSQNSTAAAL